MSTARQVDECELALEYRVLQVVTPIAHRIEHFAQSLVVADVVTDEISVAHGSTFGEKPNHP